MTWELADRSKKDGANGEACPYLEGRQVGVTVSAGAADVHVQATTGERVRLMDLWAEERALLVFLRDFGCIFCKQMGSELAGVHEPLKEAGVALVVVGLGSVEQAKAFKETTGFPAEVYVDYDAKAPQSHTIFNLESSKSVDDVMGDEKVKAAYGAAVAAGFTNDDPETRSNVNILAHGGVFVVGPGAGACDFAYRNEYVGDMPNLKLAQAIATGLLESGDEYVFPSTEQWVAQLKMTEKMSSQSAPAADKTKRPAPHRALEPVVQDPILIGCAAACAVILGTAPDAMLGAVAAMLLAVAAVAVRWWRWRASFLIPCTAMLTVKDVEALAFKMNCGDCSCDFLDETDMVTEATPAAKPPQPVFPALTAKTQLVQAKTCEDLVPLRQTICYLREFLAKPHPLLGRSGAACPFVPGSLRMNTIWLAKVYATEDDSVEDVEGVVRGYIEQFKKLEPTSGPKSLYRTLVMVFPCLPLDKANQYIDGVQLALKAETVSNAMMIGEFHMYNNAASLRNDAFFPLRTPYPSLALRPIVPGDLVFLKPDKYPAAMREEMLGAFVRHFDTEDGRKKISATDLDIAKEDLQLARDDLAKEAAQS